MRIRDFSLIGLLGGLGFSVYMTVASAQTTAVAAGQALTFRVAGSSLTDSTGANVGNIEALSIEPQSGQVKFVMVSLGFPANRTTVTPIPWQLIQYRNDARAAGGIPGTFQQFIVPVPRQVLQSAPQIDSQMVSRTADAAWMTTSWNYFAPLAAAGGIGAASGTQTGTQNSSGNPLTANPSVPNNAAFAFTNQLVPQRFTNSSLPGALPPARTPDGALPADGLPPGTVPANGLPAGTLPAGALPPATVPAESTAPAPPLTPRKVPLASATPSTPTK